MHVKVSVCVCASGGQGQRYEFQGAGKQRSRVNHQGKVVGWYRANQDGGALKSAAAGRGKSNRDKDKKKVDWLNFRFSCLKFHRKSSIRPKTSGWGGNMCKMMQETETVMVFSWKISCNKTKVCGSINIFYSWWILSFFLRNEQVLITATAIFTSIYSHRRGRVGGGWYIYYVYIHNSTFLW